MLAHVNSRKARLDGREFAADFAGRERLGVKRIELAPGAVDVEDQALLRPAEARQFRSLPVGFARRHARQNLQRRKCTSDEAQTAGTQELAPAQPSRSSVT